MTISMPRGDLRIVSFTLKDADGHVPAATITEIYWTVKKTFNNREFLLQKRLSDGGIENMGEGTYQFIIEPSDTDHMTYGQYVFDLEFVGPEIKETHVGEFVLTNEVTHANNEGA